MFSMCGSSVTCPTCGTKFDPEKNKSGWSDILSSAIEGASQGAIIGVKKGWLGAVAGAIGGVFMTGDLKCPKCGKVFDNPNKE